MPARGRIKNGKVLLDKPSTFPDGTEVEVRAVKKSAKASKNGGRKKPPARSLADRLAPFIGKAAGLPADMSVNLDHYLYGHPKRQ